MTDRTSQTLIYTDGACSGNPGPGGWGSIVAFCDGRVREFGGPAARTTNNRMEMTAAIEALKVAAARHEPIVLLTDSTYLISGATQWLHGWKRRGWRGSTGEPVLNQDLWLEVDALLGALGRRLSWRYVRGHTGNPGNERCDEIAVAFSLGRAPELYDGPLSSYPRDLTPPAHGEPPPRRASGPRPAAQGPAVYLSLVDGRLERHRTWQECHARVGGKSGARFKKVRSADEESQTLRQWGAGGPA